MVTMFVIQGTNEGGVNAEYKHHTLGDTQMDHTTMKSWSLTLRNIQIKPIRILLLHTHQNMLG